jgi:hypothetical protein
LDYESIVKIIEVPTLTKECIYSNYLRGNCESVEHNIFLKCGRIEIERRIGNIVREEYTKVTEYERNDFDIVWKVFSFYRDRVFGQNEYGGTPKSGA